MKRLIVIILTCLLLATVVLAATESITLGPGDELHVTCAGQHYAVPEQRGGTVVVGCEANPVVPTPTPAVAAPEKENLPIVIKGETP